MFEARRAHNVRPYKKHQGRRCKRVKYICDACGYIYDEAAGDPDNGIDPGTKWDELPEDFTCPLCGVDKSMFSPE